MKAFRFKSLTAFITLVTIEAFVVMAGAGLAFAATLEDVAPAPTESAPDGAHVFMIRKASGMGVQTSVYLASYTKGDPAGSTFRIAPGTTDLDQFVCSKKDNQMSAQEKQQYISVNISDWDGSPTRNVFIPYSNACGVNGARTNVYNENANNVFYANYLIPNSTGFDKDPITGRYKVEIKIDYNAAVPNGSTAPDLVQQRFILNHSMNGAFVGPLAQGEKAFPIVGDWDLKNRSGPTNITIPFGLPCNVTTKQTNLRVGVYDADNGIFDPNRVSLEVRELNTAGNWVRANLYNPTRGTISSNIFTPSNSSVNSSNDQFARIDVKAQTRYELVIRGIDVRNTIDIFLPGDVIYGAIDCRWNIQPTSKVQPTSQIKGGTVKFTHTSTNTGAFKSTDVTSTVRWGKTGVKTSGTVGSSVTHPYEASGDPGDSDTWSNTFTIPNNATAGQQYCQYLRVNPRMSGEPATDRDSTPVCVTVTANPPVDQRVTVSPSVSGGADIEPTQVTTISGRVYINNFPSDPSDWGYAQHSQQGYPSSVPATNSPYSSSNSYAGSSSPYQSGCANYNKYGTCTSWYWYCPSGSYQGTGSSAPGSCPYYRHYCTTNSWTDYSYWGTCYDRWYCPSPNYGVRYQQSAPNCNVYVCPYSSGYHSQSNPFYDTSPSQSDCEYRCNNGSGYVAYRGSAWSRTPCYQQPEFTINCYWDNGPVSGTTSEPVRSNGEYCKSSVQRTGVTIGTLVCAEISSDYPTGWRGGPTSGGGWGPYRDPGYKYDGTITRWGWTTPPATSSGCSRVVSKPTFKVDGGDVAVGGSFANNCNAGSSSASIQAWPYSRSPNWSASRTQYGAFAPGEIYGFATATLGTNGLTQPPRSLAFASYGSGDLYGGGFGAMPCIGDYYGSMPSSITNMGAFGGRDITGNGFYKYNAQNINGQDKTVKKGSQLIVYHNGDLDINTNISYEGRGTWASPADIPALKVIVRGNINIAPSVTNLDGVFVAQPGPSGGGHIYTCGGVGYGNQFNGCSRKLTVNGAFVAQKVHLGRTNSSDRNSTAILGGTAEQFNYLPEVWMARWPRDDTDTQVKYDSINNLPPIL